MIHNICLHKKYIKKIRKSLTKKDKNYGSKVNAIIGVKPYIYLLIGVILLIFSSLTFDIKTLIKILVIVFLTIYLELVLVSYVIVKKEDNKLKIKVSKTKLILYNPIFLLSYIICLIKAITTKDLKWEVVEHDKELVREE